MFVTCLLCLQYFVEYCFVLMCGIGAMVCLECVDREGGGRESAMRRGSYFSFPDSCAHDVQLCMGRSHGGIPFYFRDSSGSTGFDKEYFCSLMAFMVHITAASDVAFGRMNVLFV